jgi:hypothetical protein
MKYFLLLAAFLQIAIVMALPGHIHQYHDLSKKLVKINARHLSHLKCDQDMVPINIDFPMAVHFSSHDVWKALDFIKKNRCRVSSITNMPVMFQKTKTVFLEFLQQIEYSLDFISVKAGVHCNLPGSWEHLLTEMLLKSRKIAFDFTWSNQAYPSIDSFLKMFSDASYGLFVNGDTAAAESVVFGNCDVSSNAISSLKLPYSIKEFGLVDCDVNDKKLDGLKDLLEDNRQLTSLILRENPIQTIPSEYFSYKKEPEGKIHLWSLDLASSELVSVNDLPKGLTYLRLKDDFRVSKILASLDLSPSLEVELVKR